MTTITVGGESGSIVLSIADPKPRTDRSEGWLACDIAVHIDGWKGRYAGQFHEWDFVAFAEGLRGLSSTLSGEARLSSLDGYLDVNLSGDGLGRISVVGEAWQQPRHGTHLEFAFELDQSDLRGIEATLATLITELGTPERP